MFRFKSFVLATAIISVTTLVQAGECNYTAQPDAFKLGLTGFGFPDKSYDVKDIVFTDYQINAENNQLLNGEIAINGQSIDTTADKRNWDRNGEWPDATLQMRNSNIANGLFKNFADEGKILAKVTAISADVLDLEVTMNGVSQTVKVPYTIEAGVLTAKGTLDMADFNTSEALKTFAALCTMAWHRGKTWTDVAFYFTVPVAESGCQ